MEALQAQFEVALRAGLDEWLHVIYREPGSWIEEDRALDLQADALVMAGRKADAVADLERVLALRELTGGMDLAEVRDRLESLR
ncbi:MULTISPECIES: hypothetical protein [unclassified Streptomyces]|uniref:hypothetical protein n=1 Tax=Streptomyces TaxID=1883 RepID=UPI0013E3024C|nr:MULTISPECIES: hypothetical protein [unclassified Streptomyces]UQA33607.1 hypothetical protein KRR37_07430 [Streptomyces sp. HNA39]